MNAKAGADSRQPETEALVATLSAPCFAEILFYADAEKASTESVGIPAICLILTVRSAKGYSI